jgi:hypothetical protein
MSEQKVCCEGEFQVDETNVDKYSFPDFDILDGDEKTVKPTPKEISKDVSPKEWCLLVERSEKYSIFKPAQVYGPFTDQQVRYIKKHILPEGYSRYTVFKLQPNIPIKLSSKFITFDLE